MALDTLIRAPRAVIDGRVTAAVIGLRGERVVEVRTADALDDLEPAAGTLEARAVVDLAPDEVLLPGLVDTHVHVNEPGRTEWEGFTSATRAAARGGVTTIVDMPLNSVPPTTSVRALEAKRDVARSQAFVDVGFWGGAVPGNLEDLAPLHDEGVFGFKCFLLHSGVDEFPHLPPDDFEAAMRETARLGALMIVHAEDPHAIEHAHPADGRAYAGFLHSRPRGAENLAVAQVIELARWTGARAHVLHLSSSDALPMIRSARDDGVALSVETCPHYLTFTAEEIPDGATEFKCCPPIREATNRDRLWDGLIRGDIDLVVTDHSPCTVDLKALDSGDFGKAWGGIAGLQLGLAATWTGARARGLGLPDVVRWMAEAPAAQVGLTTKGRIAVGMDADLAVFAPDDEFVVEPAALHHKNPVSAYAGRTLTGVVRQTWLHGTPVDVDAAPRGRLLWRGDA
ncbi:allantoinase AllB [Terrabacter sp. MAHUQ-38]|uniref:allantoinase AllB n=1 Tax=unclassified Terrabacter TaxID=2630222 RepID=UPI00165DEA82|nr:allantoinase AllB [Terrabacter sp. MAHUQ-38]MBC9823066.1 allantoinase AllB [Terrabacter sp. MAHUQ-38]